jgi:putative selenate reductase molybdopterin-binding subunit
MKVVNKSLPKKEGHGLMEDRLSYTNDLVPGNALIVKVLRSPYAYAKIEDIDISKAEKIPGVRCILTHKNVPRNIITRAGQGYPEPSPHDKYIIDEYVRYIGDEVACVAAETEDIAEMAIKEIEVKYRVYKPVLDYETADGNETIIHMEKEAHEMFPIGFNPSKNIAAEYHMEFGDVDKTLSECKYVVKERYYTQAQSHCAMETHTCFAYIDTYGRITIVTSNQTPFHIRRITAHALGISLDKIRVIKPRIGGGFGGKQAVHGEILAALIALRTGRPSKLTYTRDEVFEATYTRHPMRFDLTMGADEKGIIKVMDMELLSNTGAYGEHALTVFMGAGSKTLSLYNKSQAGRFGGKVVYTNNTPAGAFRGYGAIQGNFALESTVDKLAEKIGMDPMEIRRINVIDEKESSPVFKIMGEGTEGVDMILDSDKIKYCIDRSMELSDWKNKYPRRDMGNSKVRGLGSAICLQGSGIAGIDMGSAVIKLNDEGFFNLIIGATDIGTGSDTILAQIAAEGLNVPFEKIVVHSSDTDLGPFDTGAYASSTTYVSGNAVLRAAVKMKALIEETAAMFLETDKANLDGDTITSEDGASSIGLKELSNKLYYNVNQKQLITCGSFVGEISPVPFVAGIAEVEVDTETGKVTLLDYTAVVDCGTTINPNLARVQVEGGLLQGIGMAMFENVKYADNGKLLTNSFLSYKVPTRKDINSIRVEFADSYEESGPYGAKSVGEIGIDTPPAAIANAVYNAVGVRITELPITPEKVLMGLKSRK